AGILRCWWRPPAPPLFHSAKDPDNNEGGRGAFGLRPVGPPIDRVAGPIRVLRRPRKGWGLRRRGFPTTPRFAGPPGWVFDASPHTHGEQCRAARWRTWSAAGTNPKTPKPWKRSFG